MLKEEDDNDDDDDDDDDVNACRKTDADAIPPSNPSRECLYV